MTSTKSIRMPPKKTRRKRKGTIASAARQCFKSGMTNEDAFAALKSLFPEAKTTLQSVRAMRAAFRAKGEKIPGAREVKIKNDNPSKPKKRIKESREATAEKPAKKTPASQVIAIASDHAGVALKEALKAIIEEQGLTPLDLGTNDTTSVDYPDFANAVAQSIAKGKAERGVVICGSGIGISIAINRHRHIRAALATDGLTAKLSRQHNNANVLALGARLTGEDTAKDALRQFLTTPYEGGRHQNRIDKMS